MVPLSLKYEEKVVEGNFKNKAIVIWHDIIKALQR